MDSKQLTALMTKRDDLITFLNANLEKQIQESQQGLLKKFLAGFGDLLQTDETGKVLNNAFNRNLLLISFFLIFNQTTTTLSPSRSLSSISFFLIFNQTTTQFVAI